MQCSRCTKKSKFLQTDMFYFTFIFLSIQQQFFLERISTFWDIEVFRSISFPFPQTLLPTLVEMDPNIDNLRTHLKTHNGERTNKCNQCDFASSYASALRRHLKNHSGEKPYKCNQCDYASSKAGNLRAHLKTHSGEKSNKCNQCDYASSRPN